MENEIGLERITERENNQSHIVSIGSPAEGYIVVQAKTGGIILPEDRWTFEDWQGFKKELGFLQNRQEWEMMLGMEKFMQLEKIG
ncbi:hypothetical protein CMI45_02325 [Candidatus Pacearchaeota archaeon]|nr:hypothetical protein [Candidatus Pacearchaeota archaeon]|tara:strand:+ start:1009 stop:1263 length:255 start_codon:yes stop_codon:yes gene_type:complete